MDPSLSKNTTSLLWSRKGGDQKCGPSFWVLWTAPAPQRDSISCYRSPKNVTWVWVSLREIYIAWVQALTLWFVLPADTAETTRARKTESDFGASHLLQQQSKLNGEHVEWVGRLLLTNKSSLSCCTKLCCTSDETDHYFSFCVSTISPPGLREIQTCLRSN